MLALGLDLATTTGWALLEVDSVGGFDVEWGAIDANEPTKAADEPEGVRFVRIVEGVLPLLDGVDVVGIEETYSRSYRTAHVLGGLTAAVLVELERRGIPYVFVPASTLKKWATGDGRASKEDMRHKMNSALGTDAEIGEDAIDAAWVARWVAAHRVR